MLMTTSIALAEAKGDGSIDLDVFAIVFVGFFFVLFVLMLLFIVTSIMGRFFARAAAKDQSVGANATQEIDTSSFTTEENDPHLIAVIAAAVHCVLGEGSHRIVSIRSANSSWAKEGRRQIFSSHQL